jgi:hypothetical protein
MYMNTTGKFYIYKATIIDDQLHDKHRVQHNDIFETITEDEGHMTYGPPPLLPRLDTRCMQHAIRHHKEQTCLKPSLTYHVKLVAYLYKIHT